jgi:uncharacterized protein (TIGR02246 family)
MATVQVRYIVKDVDAAIAFYRDRLGFTEAMHPAPAFAMLTRGDLRLVLSAPNPAGGGGQPMPDGRQQEPGGWNRFAIEVADLAATVEKLRQSGVRFRNDIVTGVGGKQILVEDPSGNPIELFQPLRPEARLGTIAESTRSAASASPTDELAIRELVAAWMAATKAGDLAKVLSLMADDVVFLVPGRPPFGKADFAAAWQGMQGVRIEGRNDIEEIQVLGDWAFTRNRLDLAVTPPGGTPVCRAGYTLSLYRKAPTGAWVLARDANLLGPA